MNGRTARILIGALAVVCVGLVFSVVYPVTTSEPHATNPPDERFTVPDEGAYSVTGRILVDGEVRLAFEGAVTPDGAWYQRVEEEHVASDEYRPAASGTRYRRLTIDGRERAERRREQITNDETRELVRDDRDGDRVTFVVEEEADVREPVSGTASVFVRSLAVVGYGAERTASSGMTVYEPQSGWYDGSEPYRITGASGEVRADAETHAVRSANVSWDVTVPAGTYAEYVLVRFVGDDPAVHRIEVDFDPNDHDLERPAWVDDTGPE